MRRGPPRFAQQADDHVGAEAGPCLHPYQLLLALPTPMTATDDAATCRTSHPVCTQVARIQARVGGDSSSIRGPSAAAGELGAVPSTGTKANVS